LAIALYFVAGFGLGAPRPLLGSGVAAGFTVLALGLIPFALNVMGAGDVKLAAAAALWLGFPLMLPFLFLVSLYGGVMLIVIVGFKREIGAVHAPGIAFFEELGSQLPMPYGIAIAAATLHLFPSSPLLRLA
ncbi:prepilin peptidase, partial [Mycobacterium tuberculosis]|nr:prepilin peptidase [Mycobacterium tuberculosis]